MSIRIIKGTSVKVHTTLVIISIPVRDDLLDEGDDFRYVFCHPSQRVWPSYPQARHVFEELVFPIGSQRPEYRWVGDSGFVLRILSLVTGEYAHS